MTADFSSKQCSDCGAPNTAEHFPGCDAPLTRCVKCNRPVITVANRPIAGTETIACGACRTVQFVPSSLVRAAIVALLLLAPEPASAHCTLPRNPAWSTCWTMDLACSRRPEKFRGCACARRCFERVKP